MVNYACAFSQSKLGRYFENVFKIGAIKGKPTRLLPHAKIKMLLVPIKFFPLLGRSCSGRFYIVIFTEQMWFACFTLRGHDTHIDLLWLLFLVGRICPLMQAHFLWPLLNKGSSFLQSVFWIGINKWFSLVRESYVFLQCRITLGPAR